ncbi:MULTISPECIES: hypothetical protein [unclassified Bradyrhizobium]|uniref:hypothetical protein n=1 Tax=unclassified Bradyrhizobium TaxID=2631580 RepID=UPI001FF77C85|nr:MULTISPECIES: hypothetical protein [unclassified Bradyrhizobium]MCK1418896.1 hypothetical protein [Bradyrhizobium sp. CW4]MCK1570807.1 hypothetical protein [Bradyrhizobium sp. 174]
MRTEPNPDGTVILLFAIAVTVAAFAAFITTFERVRSTTASGETSFSTAGFAKPRPHLDRAPGHQ